MPKYRLLTKEELIQFEKEFTEYLVVNGIDGPSWKEMKESDPEKAEDITDLFSDVVFEGAMRKVKFMEFRSKKELFTFQCLEDKMILVGMWSKDDSLDFTDEDFIAQASIQLAENDIKVFTTEKKYTKQRELELFEMTQNGCEITDGKLFKTLSLALV